VRTRINKIDADEPLLKLKRVCAYARVSSEKEAMLQSLSSQVSHYNKMISSNSKWQFIGVYADEGISGTKEDRPEFKRMVDDAKAGKIDLIITKSISRFGRNTETVIRTIREMNALGVDVYFESQNLHTLSADGEFMLTLLASFYQEEARSVSENMKCRIKKDFEKGISWGARDFYGYKVVNKNFIVVPEQAEVIQRIFNLYIGGLGILAITKQLNQEGIKPMYSKLWSYSSLFQILKNNSYTGDLILQKTYLENHLTKKKVKNNGEFHQYHVEDNHEPIISKETFKEAQIIRNQRANRFKTNVKRATNAYPFTNKIKCGCCGGGYQHKTTPKHDFWICSTYNTQGKAFCSESRRIPEKSLYETLNEYLGTTSFDERKFNKKVNYMVAQKDNKIELHLINGTVDEITWKEISRKDSWTPEMKEKARQNTKKTNENRRVLKWEKLESYHQPSIH
jgi:DNA invertase Pin-like site-specific DNA recombinase